MSPHLSIEEILSVVDEPLAPIAEVERHLAECPGCAGLLDRCRSALAELPEILSERLDCPPPEELDLIPRGGEFEYPHLNGCPFCADELGALRALQDRRLYDEAFSGGPPLRSSLFVDATRSELVAGRGKLEIAIERGARASEELAGVFVTLSVEEGRLEVRVSAEPAFPLDLVLVGDLLEKRMTLQEGTVSVPVASWRKARVERRPRSAG